MNFKLKPICISLGILCPISVSFNACKNAPTETTADKTTVVEKTRIDSANQELTIDLAALMERNKANAATIAVDYDHYFKKPKRFLGLNLATIIDSVVRANHFDTSNTVVVFDCKDGYKPTMNLAKMYTKKGFIAFKDLEAKGKSLWIDSMSARLEPYYLVWQNVPPSDNSFTWPYGLTTLRLVPASDEFKDIYPFQNPEMVKGFTLFRDNCNKCHAVNQVGGVMGPEFNVPKNITEYWREEDMIQFAHNPTSYRISSKMPPMSDVSTEDLKEIISYLRFMANHKLK